MQESVDTSKNMKKEILELKEKGLTKCEIGETFGLIKCKMFVKSSKR